MLRQFRSRKRKCPGLTALRILFGSLQVVVKVAAAEHIIAGSVFFCHIIAQHLNLSLADLIAVAVSGHMQIEDHQLFPVVHRDPGDTVATVQIEELAEGSGYGEASAQGGRHRIFREQSESCPAAAVGLGKRIEQESRVIILRKYGSIFRQNVAQHLVLIRMIASGGIQIDLLDQRKIRV